MLQQKLIASESEIINIENFPSGNYLIKLISENGNEEIKKFSKYQLTPNP